MKSKCLYLFHNQKVQFPIIRAISSKKFSIVFRLSFDPSKNQTIFFQRVNFQAIRAKFQAILCLVSTLSLHPRSTTTVQTSSRKINSSINKFLHGYNNCSSKGKYVSFANYLILSFHPGTSLWVYAMHMLKSIRYTYFHKPWLGFSFSSLF